VKDAHNHLQDPRLNGERAALISTMRQSGITRCVVNGTSPSDWEQVADLAETYPDFIIPSFGLHPWMEVSDGWLEKLVEYVTRFPRSGIGECGLDRAMKNYDLELQKEIFSIQLDLAAARNLPLTIHCTKSWGPLIEILESRRLPQRGFLLHAYSGSRELVPRFTELGAYFSFSARHLRAKTTAFQSVPSDRILIETDLPNNLIDGRLTDLATISKKASEVLDVSCASENFSRFFGV